MLTGENGILRKADSETRETEIAEAKEQAKLDIAEWIAEQLEKGKEANINNSIIQEILLLKGKEYVGTAESDKFTTKQKGYEIPYSDLYTNTIGGNTTPGDSEEENTVIPGVTVTGKNKKYTKNGTAIIPVGFSIVEEFDDISEGLVITDEVGNEFVWIPVTSESEYVKNKNYVRTEISENTISDTDYLPIGVEIPEGKSEEDVEKEMVVKAGGFYIARYEAGKEESDTVVSKREATVWNNISQTEAKTKAKTFIHNEYVKSALITKVQWDATMAFIASKPRVDGKGNSYDVKNYSNRRHLGVPKPAGWNEEDKVCNIYDLEGNYYEYIAEKSTYQENTPYLSRGGWYDTKDINAAGNCNDYKEGVYSYISFRLVLYV